MMRQGLGLGLGWFKGKGMGMGVGAGVRAVALIFAAAVLLPGGVDAQDATRRELRESQIRLEQIRQERERLQREMNSLRSRVRDVSSELANIDRQVDASADALREVDFQLSTLANEIARIDDELARSRGELRARRQSMNERLRSMYKRGPLHAVRVLLSAENFGDLLNRYRYLHVIALHDRALIANVEQLERMLSRQEGELRENVTQLDALRADKAQELAQLQELGSQRQRTLRDFRQREERTEGRLQQLARDEARLNDMIAELERKRLEAERAATTSGRAAAAGALSTRDMGSLPWPVDGDLIYRFGVERKPTGVVLRHNGIGIAAPAGTSVRAVEAGRVDMARAFEGYGPTVILSHGGGYYTLYHFLGRIGVREGQTVTAGQVIGTVGEGSAGTPHIEFRVHVPINNALPEPVDPIGWLRERGQP